MSIYIYIHTHTHAKGSRLRPGMEIQIEKNMKKDMESWAYIGASRDYARLGA